MVIQLTLFWTLLRMHNMTQEACSLKKIAVPSLSAAAGLHWKRVLNYVYVYSGLCTETLEAVSPLMPHINSPIDLF